MQARDNANKSLNNISEQSTMNKPNHPYCVPPREDNAKAAYRAPPTGHDDDVDVMLKHEDFPRLLELAVEIHQLSQSIQASTGKPYSTQQSLPKCSLTPNETLQATLNLQEMLLSNPGGVRSTVRRGEYPITDAIMDDSLDVLTNKLQDMKRFQSGGRSDDASPPKKKQSTKKTQKKDSKKKEAIAVKYSKWQTDILMTWMIKNKEQPFPDQKAIESLMEKTGLSHSQVVNWTTNVRKRNRKATCQGGKKPHHFIDFLFLAQDRETRRKKEKQGRNDAKSRHRSPKEVTSKNASWRP